MKITHDGEPIASAKTEPEPKKRAKEVLVLEDVVDEDGREVIKGYSHASGKSTTHRYYPQVAYSRQKAVHAVCVRLGGPVPAGWQA